MTIPNATLAVSWSHLTMAAYEFFLQCDLCGAMVHDAPSSKSAHEAFHQRIEEHVLYPQKFASDPR